MCAHPVSRISPSAGPPRSDRAGEGPGPATPSGGPARRWFSLRLTALLSNLRPTAFKPLTYSAMHLAVAVTVAFVLTRDWRIAFGVGVIEPIVQTFAYMAHEKVWSLGRRAQPEVQA